MGRRTRKAGMERLNEALRERLVELTGSSEGRQPILSTTGTQAAIAELIARSDRLEKAIGEIALEVETLAAAQKGGASTRGVAPASDR
jgi:hypothetical protein